MPVFKNGKKNKIIFYILIIMGWGNNSHAQRWYSIKIMVQIGDLTKIIVQKGDNYLYKWQQLYK